MKPAGLVKLSRWKKIIRKNEDTENKKAVDAGVIRAPAENGTERRWRCYGRRDDPDDPRDREKGGGDR